MARSTFKPQWYLCFRSLVLRPDSDSAPAGEHLWVRKRCGKWSTELYELPDGPAPLHHGHLCSTATALWHPSYYFCTIHHNWAHYVLPVCAQSQKKTPPRYIRSRHGPHIQAWDASTDSTLHMWNECLPPVPTAILLHHSTPDLAIHFSTTQQESVPPRLLSSCRAMCHSSKQELRWSTVGDTLRFVYISWGGHNKRSNGTSRGDVLI